MRTFLLSSLITILQLTCSLSADDWPPENLKGAWRVTYASSDGEEVEQAKDNIIVFHNNQMIFAYDRNYGPPNSELGAIGYKFHAMTITDLKSYGLARVQRGELKFMLERSEEEGREIVVVRIEDYRNNRVHEIVQYKAERMDTLKAHDRIRWLLGSPKYEAGDARTYSVEALEDWLRANSTGEPSHEPKSP